MDGMSSRYNEPIKEEQRPTILQPKLGFSAETIIRLGLLFLLLLICGALLLAFTAYGMLTRDEGILAGILILLNSVISGILGFALGRYNLGLYQPTHQMLGSISPIEFVGAVHDQVQFDRIPCEPLGDEPSRQERHNHEIRN